MSVNKKKSPGRPKKEFISKKPKTKIKSWPGRPRKDQQQHIAADQASPAVVWFVAKPVDDGKKKDMIIFLLFLLSFVLFVVSLYFTFMKKEKNDLEQSELAEITNVETGNIDYESIDSGFLEETPTTGTTIPEQEIQPLTTQQQMIVDFYQAVNAIDMNTIYMLTDAHLEASNVFKTYYSKRWLTKFSETIIAPKIIVTNIQEIANTTGNPNIKNFTYTLEYVLANNQQKFTEERSTVLVKKGDSWRIGKLLCETKWCSTMPFFNPDKYK